MYDHSDHQQHKLYEKHRPRSRRSQLSEPISDLKNEQRMPTAKADERKSPPHHTTPGKPEPKRNDYRLLTSTFNKQRAHSSRRTSTRARDVTSPEYPAIADVDVQKIDWRARSSRR